MRVFLYILPAVVDIIVGIFFFVSAKRMANSNASSYMVALTMTTWAVFYALSSFATGFVLNKRNAMRLIKISLTIMLVSLCGLAFTDNLNLQFAWLVGTGLGGALYFTSYQPVIKLLGASEYELRDMVSNSAVYTFSWSMGLALGPFIAAFVWGLFDSGNGWRYCYFIAIALLLLVFAGVFALSPLVRRRLVELGEDKDDDKLPDIPEEQRRLPDLMMAGWLLQGIGYIAVAMMRTYIPDYCTKILEMNTFHQGIVMSLVSFAQAFTGLACYKASRWPYRPWVVGGISLAALGGFVIFTATSDWRLYAVAAILLGIFSGMMCFVCTFHALVNPTKTARYVSVNETLVGVGSVVAPMLGGFLAIHCGSLAPFFCCMLSLLACAVIYACYTWKCREM